MTTRRLILLLLAIGLLASLFVAVRRERHEHAARLVEIVMDDADFSALAQAYAYNEPQLLVAFRRAGLTSLAVSEELGANINGSKGGAVYSGGTLLAQARITPLSDPLFARLVRENRIDTQAMYLIAYDAPTAQRYAVQVALKFSPHAVRRLRTSLPAVWAIRTQPDYFAGEAFGLPYDRMALAKRLHLRLVPRLQNDEGFTPATIDRLVASSVDHQRADTAIFFGLRNEVLGYPDQYPAAAAALRAHGLSFGAIEFYDPKQDQLGNEELATAMPDATVRVQAIAKTEADKLTPPQIIARYLLGVNERNIRVVYLRPFEHTWNGKSIEATNVEIIRQIADGIRRGGRRTGPATPFTHFEVGPLEVVLCSLAVPAMLALVLGALGWRTRALLIVLFAGDLLLLAAGYASHHDMLARKLLGLAAGLAFPAAGFLGIGWAFRGDPGPLAARNPYLRGLIALVIAGGITLCGALVITGLLSTPLTMIEIDRFAGVKYVLVLPALVALALYFFSDRFGSRLDWRTAGDAPVRVAQLLVGLVLIAGAYLLLERSGNQPDIAPSDFELSLRSHLTALLDVRPRFKDFGLGFPALMLLPALIPTDRRRWGWVFVLAIGVLLGDLIDTFSHLHTPLRVGVLRVGLGGVLGALIGAVLIALYGRFRSRL